jgi:hypothetical protein
MRPVQVGTLVGTVFDRVDEGSVSFIMNERLSRDRVGPPAARKMTDNATHAQNPTISHGTGRITSVQEWDATLATNLGSAFATVRASAVTMRQTGDGLGVSLVGHVWAPWLDWTPRINASFQGQKLTVAQKNLNYAATDVRTTTSRSDTR